MRHTKPFLAARIVRACFTIALASLCLCYTPALAQEDAAVKALWEMDVAPEGGWTVGDPIPMRLRVIAPADVAVTLPELPEQWGDFEIQAQSAQAPSDNDEDEITYLYAVTAVLWQPGEHETPPLTITIEDSDGETKDIPVHTLTVTISSVLTEEDQEKRDLKPQATLPRPPIWPWVLGGVLLAPLLFLGGRWLWRRLPRHERALAETQVEPVDDRPPEEIAYERLNAIAAMKLPVQGAYKEHYTLVSNCIRAYVEGQHHVAALDRTTYELITVLARGHLRGEALQVLRRLLYDADLVKFAKFTPTINAAHDALTRARYFVDITKPQRIQETETENPA